MFNISQMEQSSAIQKDEEPLVNYILKGLVGATIGGLIAGLLFAFATIVIYSIGYFGLMGFFGIGCFMGMILGAVAKKIAGRASLLLGAITVLGSCVAFITGFDIVIYWYLRDEISSPLDLALLEIFLSTYELTTGDFLTILGCVGAAFMFATASRTQQPQETTEPTH